MKLTVLDRQSIFDLAVQALGSAEAAFSIALLNDLPLNEELNAGQTINLPTIAHKAIAEYYKNKGLKPATGITGNIWDNISGDGLGYNKRIFDYTFNLNFE